MSLKLLSFGFAAGFAATLVFHQGLWWVFNQTGVIPPALPAWPTTPIPPFGVPAVISMSFWGGIWGVMLAPLLARLSGQVYWFSWVVIGALALTSVAFFVVPLVKGQPIPALWPRFLLGMMLNGAWGFGTGLFLRFLRAGKASA